jgi:ribose/xylose/arabinose/galactoside ABC-type transport system permease subunit
VQSGAPLITDAGRLSSVMRHLMDMQRFLIGLGLVILIAGIAWPYLSRIGLGRLPGDILIQRGGTTFYFPLVTCIIISIVLSLLLWLFNR